MKNIKSFILWSFVAIIFTTAAGITQAETYYSPRGEFYFWHPDNWEQLDFNTVDEFLRRRKASDDAFNYEAVFAPRTNSPFFKGNYLIVTVEKIGFLDSLQTDSLLKSTGGVFNPDAKYFPVGDYSTNLKSDLPYWDAENRMIKIITEVKQDNQPFRKNLLDYKLYKHGIAKFWFYSTDSLFDSSWPLFDSIAYSLSTENIDSVISNKSVKIADIDTSEKDDDSGPFGLPVAVFVSVVVVIIVVARKRKKARKS